MKLTRSEKFRRSQRRYVLPWPEYEQEVARHRERRRLAINWWKRFWKARKKGSSR